mmetsp:Transcript_121186/g.387096  ORF Transcript_121186/g.387096 Transcript_121186/m.387096 type:complete len:279 (+) Transcript_121186:1400-2236(+)
MRLALAALSWCRSPSRGQSGLPFPLRDRPSAHHPNSLHTSAPQQTSMPKPLGSRIRELCRSSATMCRQPKGSSRLQGVPTAHDHQLPVRETAQQLAVSAAIGSTCRVLHVPMIAKNLGQAWRTLEKSRRYRGASTFPRGRASRAPDPRSRRIPRQAPKARSPPANRRTKRRPRTQAAANGTAQHPQDPRTLHRNPRHAPSRPNKVPAPIPLVPQQAAGTATTRWPEARTPAQKHNAPLNPVLPLSVEMLRQFHRCWTSATKQLPLAVWTRGPKTMSQH